VIFFWIKHILFTLGKTIFSMIKFHGIAKKIMPKKSLSHLIMWRFCILDVLFTHTIVALLMAQVWTGHPTKFSFQNHIIEFPMTQKTYSKINILCTLALKFSKSPSLNPTHWGLSNNIQSAPKFPYNI
jgi:hypothetical protein